MRQTATPKYELVQDRLGRDLATYLSEALGANRSLRGIARDLTTATGVPVSYETVRAWARTPERAA